MADTTQDSPSFNSSKQIICKKHHSHEIIVFCVAKNCNTPICIKCINDHCLTHYTTHSQPILIEMDRLFLDCESKIRNSIEEISAKLENIRKNPEEELKRQTSEKELEKIIKSKEYLLNYIEKYFEEIEENWLSTARPLEFKLEKKLSEVKKLQETIVGLKSLEVISKLHDRDLHQEISDLVQTCIVDSKETAKISVDYSRVNSNLKEELHKFIQIASPSKSSTSVISKESEASTQSSGIQILHSLLNQGIKSQNTQLESINVVENQPNINKYLPEQTPKRPNEDIVKPLANRLTFSACFNQQSSEKSSPETPHLMQAISDDCEIIKKKVNTGILNETPFNGLQKNNSITISDAGEKSPTLKNDGKKSVYQQKRSLMKQTQAEGKHKENDNPVFNFSLLNEKITPIKMNSFLTKDSSSMNGEPNTLIINSADSNLLNFSPFNQIESKPTVTSNPPIIDLDSSSRGSSNPFGLNFLEKLQAMNKAIEKKNNDSFLSNLNSLLEEDGLKTPLSIAPSNIDTDGDICLLDRSDYDLNILNTSAFANCEEDKGEKQDFVVDQASYFSLFSRKKLLCFFPWRTKEMHYLNLDFLNLQSQEAKFDITKFEIPFVVPDYHTSTITPDGEIFLIGGQNPEDPNIKYNDTWGINIETKSFLPRTPMKSKRDSHSACFLNGSVYVIGGVSLDNAGNKKIIKNCEKFDLKANKWVEVADLPIPLCNHSCTAFNDRYIFCFGGRSQDNKISNNILKLDTFTNRWMCIKLKKDNKSKFYLTSQSACSQINSNQILVFGGYQYDKKVSNQTFILDISTEKEFPNKEIFQIKHLDKNSITFAAPFWDKQVFIQNKTLFCLQNVVAHNNPKVSFNATRRIMTFDGKNWVNLN